MPEIFPFKPNWSNGYEVALSYKTDIFKSRSGIEQRRALRNTARRTVSYSSLATQDDMVAFQRLMAWKQNGNFLLPDWSRYARTHGVESGATHFSLREYVPDWLVPGATISLVDGNTIATATVLSASGYTVQLTAPVAQTLSELTVVRPVLSGLLGNINTTLNTSTAISVSVTFDVTPGSIRNSDNLYTPWLVGGKEVFGFPWNWAESLTADYEWEIDKVDFQRGVISTYRPVDFGTVTQKVTVLRQNDQVGQMLRFFERTKGRRGEFWMPSGTDDMDLVSATSTALTVAGSEIYTKFSPDPVLTGVAIYMKDGRRVYRQIDTIGLAAGNTTLNLTVPLTFSISPTTVAKISWLRPARLGSDDQTIEHLTDRVTQQQVTTVSVSFTSDPQDYTELDGAGYWVMDNWGEEAEALLRSIDNLVNVSMAFGDVDAMPLDILDDLINSEMWTALT